jgi:hypothetical protein
MAKLKTVRITAVMETHLEYVCNIPEDMSLEDFKDYCKTEDIAGGMWEQGGEVCSLALGIGEMSTP